MSAAQQLLQAARPAVPAVAAPRCQHPTRPAPLRRLSCFDEPCIELLTASTSSGNPCCILPHPPAAGGSQQHGLQRLISLHDLSASTVVDKLAAVEGHVKNVCAACPAAAVGELPRQPSPLVYRPDFACFLERCLELAQLHKGLGLAPAVLLLQIVSRLDYAADDSLRSSFSRYYLHLQVELEAACELHSEALTPQVALAVVRAWARMGALPMNSPPFGRALRSHIKAGRFTPQELSLLLAALAQQRAARPSYRPCQYDVADVCAQLAGPALQGLAAPHLASVARSLGAFPWPVYRLMPALEAVAQEAVRRQAVGEMSPGAAAALLASALASARSMHPRMGPELEAKLAGWQAQARLATGNILGFASHASGVAA